MELSGVSYNLKPRKWHIFGKGRPRFGSNFFRNRRCWHLFIFQCILIHTGGIVHLVPLCLRIRYPHLCDILKLSNIRQVACCSPVINTPMGELVQDWKWSSFDEKFEMRLPWNNVFRLVKFVPDGPIDKPPLSQVIAWCREGGMPLAERMMTHFTWDYYIVVSDFTDTYHIASMSKTVVTILIW